MLTRLKRIVKSRIFGYAIALKLGIILIVAVMALPYIHERLLFKSVSRSVMRIVVPSNHASGGTGFQLQVGDKQYTVTNRHVCELNEDGFMVAKLNDEGSLIAYLPIIRISKKTDLCLLAGIAGTPALKLAGSAGEGDEIASVGHPMLQHVTLTRGKITNTEVLEMLGAVNIPAAKCTDEYGGRTEEAPLMIQIFTGIKTGCIIKIKTYRTTATIFGGNSGSPLVNIFGRVEGVLFAAMEGQNWGYSVILEDLKDFLDGK